ncbi:hypothetical protein PT974_02135 [Cladobotryum mycophilum]|uniref:Alginate lyase 2 domain-containing protein n=1 Tax=Cladobotryum mycophilum TaxID=491253 RepID=A0ABR0SXB4_9HYPO
MNIKSSLCAFFLYYFALIITIAKQQQPCADLALPCLFSSSRPSAPTSSTPPRLNPDCAPGGNFDLSNWRLELPTAQPATVEGAKLTGCQGYQDEYFYTQKSDGALVMTVPDRSSNKTRCVTTPTRKYCHNELRELAVMKTKGRMCVGQIHMDESISNLPVAELFVYDSGGVEIGVQTCRTCQQGRFWVGGVTPYQKFKYDLWYEGGSVSVSLNDGDVYTFNATGLDSPDSFFRLGNYNHANSVDSTYGEVHVYDIAVSHG